MKRKPQSDDTSASGDGSNSREEEMLIPKNKRPREDEEDNINENKIPPPKYGTKEYWEARYKSHLPGMHMDETSCTLDGVVLSKDATKPGHEWYFTYDELRPLIIPLILGTLDNTVAEGDYDDEDDDAESWIEEEVEMGSDNEDDEAEAEDDNDSTKQQTNCDDEDSAQHNTAQNDTAELSGTIDMANFKPKKVLEIGCGDKPLGTCLVSDLISMQSDDNGLNVHQVLGEVMCIDYSETVVQTLIAQQKDELNCNSSTKQGDTEQDTTQSSEQLVPSFQAMDARSLPLDSNSYDLILEKGTLDAMLSDENEGASNCIQIVKEMARVTSEGGAILIVSHLNANEQKGMDWLGHVVFRGLKDEFLERRKTRKERSTHTSEDTGSKDDMMKEYVWSVEVHGGDGKYLDANGDEKEPSDNDIPIYGPAVYIIKKKSVPASVAIELFGKRKQAKDEDSTNEKEDHGSSDDEALLKEMPPVKLEFITY